jgi:Phospholipid methyltransferase
MTGLRGLLTTGALFAIAAGVNTGSVALQRRGQHLTRCFGKAAWHMHLALIIPPWALFLFRLAKLDRGSRWRLPAQTRPLGAPVLAAAGLLWAAAFSRLGPARMANGYFFGATDSRPVRDGVFRWLENPVYDSYALALVGQALVTADARYLVLAAESVLLLNGLEAGVENAPFRHKRSMLPSLRLI